MDIDLYDTNSNNSSSFPSIIIPYFILLLMLEIIDTDDHKNAIAHDYV